MLKIKEIKAIKAEIMNADQKRRAELFDALINNAIEEQKKSGKSFSIDQVKKFYGLHVTQKHTGKMEGMLSLSTNMLINAFCQAHRNTKGAICEHCYADTLLSFRPSMQAPYTFNSYLLKHTILPMDNGSLYRVDNVTKNNLIKMYRAFYRALPFWDRDDETNRFITWKSLRSLTRAELYTALYFDAPEMFKRLTY